MIRTKATQILLIVFAIAMVIAIPLIIDWLIIGNSIPSNISNSDWVGFLSGYIGSIVSMLGIIITIRYTNQQNKRDKENQVKPYCAVRFIPMDKGITIHNTVARLSIGCGNYHENPDCYECLIMLKNVGLGPAVEFAVYIDDIEDGREHYPLLLERTPQTASATINTLSPNEEAAILLCVDFNFDSIPDEEVKSEYNEALGKEIYSLSPNEMNKYKEYLLTINVKYHDMYENVFSQKIVLRSDIYAIIDKDGHAKHMGGYSLIEKSIPQKIK